MPTVAACSDVTVFFGDRRVLGPLNLSVEAGQRWALLGPNGSGKTTLLSLLGAQRHPSAGHVSVLGETLGATDMRVPRRRIGVVGHSVSDLLPIQSTALEIVLTGKEALFAPWWATFDSDDRRHALALLDRLGCGHLADQPLGRCSQGERQRVLLARSLYSDHPLLLLDEPATGVDLPGREALIASLDEMALVAPSVSSFYVAHTLEELPRSTTHALLLKDGVVVDIGEVDTVLCDRSLSDCFGLSISVTRHDGRYGATARAGWVPTSQPGHC